MLLQFLDAIPEGSLPTTRDPSITGLNTSILHRLHPNLALLAGCWDVMVRLTRVRVGPLLRVRKRECGVFRQGESHMARLEKELGIPGSQASVTLRIGDTGDNLNKITFLAAHFQRPRRGGTGLHSSRRQDVHAPDAVSAKFLYTKNERNPSSSGFVTAIISISPDCITRMSTSLDHLKATGTVVVSDSGDFECKILSYITNG